MTTAMNEHLTPKAMVTCSCDGNYLTLSSLLSCVQARIQCYSLALIFFLWSKPHYRNKSFQEVGVEAWCHRCHYINANLFQATFQRHSDVCFVPLAGPACTCVEQDMVKNLRNVAIPGTGIPLSLYCSLKATVYLFILVINPVVCLMAALNAQRKHGRC